jgi:hypothetical protein
MWGSHIHVLSKSSRGDTKSRKNILFTVTYYFGYQSNEIVVNENQAKNFIAWKEFRVIYHQLWQQNTNTSLRHGSMGNCGQTWALKQRSCSMRHNITRIHYLQCSHNEGLRPTWPTRFLLVHGETLHTHKDVHNEQCLLWIVCGQLAELTHKFLFLGNPTIHDSIHGSLSPNYVTDSWDFRFPERETWRW